MHDGQGPGAGGLLPPLDPRIHKKCEEVLLKAIEAFPKLITDVEGQPAARLVANIILAILGRPIPQRTSETLQEALARIAVQHEHREQADSTGEKS